MNLSPYVNRSTNSGAMYTNVPISLLDATKKELKKRNLKYRIRYRGPRTDPWDRRCESQRMRDCLQRFANRFSVYLV